MQRQEPEHPLLIGWEVAIGQAERGADATLAVVKRTQAMRLVRQPGGETGWRPDRVATKASRGDPHCERQSTAALDDACHRLVVIGHPYTHDVSEQRDGLPDRKYVDRHVDRVIEGVQAIPAAAQHPARRLARTQAPS